MRDRIFIDTGAYIAIFHKQDAKRTDAVALWKQLTKEKVEIFTTHDIINEFATLLGRKTDYLYAAKQTHLIYTSDVVITYPSAEDAEQALVLLEKYADQQVSFTDCLSFVAMSKLNISHAFTFDKHFVFAGFELIQ